MLERKSEERVKEPVFQAQGTASGKALWWERSAYIQVHCVRSAMSMGRLVQDEVGAGPGQPRKGL